MIAVLRELDGSHTKKHRPNTKRLCFALGHQCPENPRAPHASLKWLATLKEDVFKGRSYRGKAIYYDTPEAALDGAIAEVERILENRLKRKRPAAT
jgi:hypothetical protein